MASTAVCLLVCVVLAVVIIEPHTMASHAPTQVLVLVRRAVTGEVITTIDQELWSRDLSASQYASVVKDELGRIADGGLVDDRRLRWLCRMRRDKVFGKYRAATEFTHDLRHATLLREVCGGRQYKAVAASILEVPPSPMRIDALVMLSTCSELVGQEVVDRYISSKGDHVLLHIAMEVGAPMAEPVLGHLNAQQDDRVTMGLLLMLEAARRGLEARPGSGKDLEGRVCEAITRLIDQRSGGVQQMAKWVAGEWGCARGE
jgi:hypothetical protein